MDEIKKKTSKKIGLKNKKEAAKALSKTSNTKKAKISKKQVVNKVAVKKQVSTKADEIKHNINEEVIQEKKEKKVESKRKDINTKESTKKTKTKPKTTIKKKETKKKETKKKEEKPKLVLPKEWQEINKKQQKQKEKEEEPKNEKIKGRLKKSIFEEVDEKTFQIQKQKEKDALKKTFVVILIIAAIVSLGLYLLFKYNEDVKKGLKVYDTYMIGEKVELKDGSIWYVVSDSDSSDANVKLLSESIVDINADSKFDNNDKRKYNSSNIAEYDITSENSVAQYLNEILKVDLQTKIGKIEEISLLTSKEFVKIRDKMGFGYEWSEGNWLANQKLGIWWVISSQNEQVYAVTQRGVYKLYSADSLNYVRPTIIVKKEIVKKIEEHKEDNSIVSGIKEILEN